MGVSLFTFICNSLAPIILVDYGNHIFPKNKVKAIFLFASNILFILYGRCPITKDVILDLWF